jgi:hypothetical protein
MLPLLNVSNVMNDLVYILITVGFFVVAGYYVVFCDKI